MKLDLQDLRWAVLRLPSTVKTIMKDPAWMGKMFVGGGYLRSTVSNEPINDIDIFVQSKQDAEHLALLLAKSKSDIYNTDNAHTIKSKPTLQIIHRWVFDKPEDVSNSFDFTICCAVIYYDGKNFDSFCDDRFYIDLAAKRLVYRRPIRNEDAGGSMLRVLKYYQKGYRIPLDSMGYVIARLISGIDFQRINMTDEESIGKIISGLLREVDPEIDPLHLSHLPSETEPLTE